MFVAKLLVMVIDGTGRGGWNRVWENFPLTKFISVLLGLFNNMSALHLQSESISKTEIFMVRLVYLSSHLDPGDIEMCK